MEFKKMIIAEIGLNHEADFDQAMYMLDQLMEVQSQTYITIIPKFQIYTADTLAHITASKYWHNNSETSQHQLFQKQLTNEQYHALFKECSDRGFYTCSSIFSVQLLQEFDYLDIYKVASGDLTYVQLLTHLQELKDFRGCDIILSTGGATDNEIKNALETVEADYLLHCVQDYPTMPENAGLNRINHLKKFSTGVGYSCHVPYLLDVLTTAYLLGAEVIEKHFTIDKTRPGYDHGHSMDKDDLIELTQKLQRLEEFSIGAPNELAKEQTRRSIVAKRDLPKGTILTENDLICLRPATGIPANHFYQILNLQLTKDVSQGDILEWGDLK